jgi:hydroxymethylpyrimidine pyrophosphatase-like HAD family hydrolase
MNDAKDSEEEEDVKVRLKQLRTSRRIVVSDDEDDDDDKNEMDVMEEDPREENNFRRNMNHRKMKNIPFLSYSVELTNKGESKEVKMKKVGKETKTAKKRHSCRSRKS